MPATSELAETSQLAAIPLVVLLQVLLFKPIEEGVILTLLNEVPVIILEVNLRL